MYISRQTNFLGVFLRTLLFYYTVISYSILGKTSCVTRIEIHFIKPSIKSKKLKNTNEQVKKICSKNAKMYIKKFDDEYPHQQPSVSFSIVIFFF